MPAFAFDDIPDIDPDVLLIKYYLSLMYYRIFKSGKSVMFSVQ